MKDVRLPAKPLLFAPRSFDRGDTIWFYYKDAITISQ
jgi:hypothetical protein